MPEAGPVALIQLRWSWLQLDPETQTGPTPVEPDPGVKNWTHSIGQWSQISRTGPEYAGKTGLMELDLWNWISQSNCSSLAALVQLCLCSGTRLAQLNECNMTN